MAVAPPADKRFRRSHVSPARRRRRVEVSWMRVARAVAAGAVLVYAGYRGTDVLLSTDALTVTRITVSGNSMLSQGEVVALVEGLRGRNMMMVSLEDWRQKLLTSSWVADAAIRRVLPGTVDVLISERQPTGIARIGGVLYLIDRQGALIDEFGPNHAAFDLPLIDGLTAGDGAPGGASIDAARAALAARLMSSLQDRPDLAARVSQIDVSDLRDVAVVLKGDTTLIRIGNERFADRLQSYVDLAPALRERVQQIDSVDVRFGHRVYVTPQSLRASGPQGPRRQ